MSNSISSRDVVGVFNSWSKDPTGMSVSDSGWFAGAVFEQFLAARAMDISEDMKLDKSTVNKFTQQYLGCEELEEVPTESCPCPPPSECTWRVTKELPIPIGQLISVTGLGGNLEELETYTYRDWYAIKYSLNAIIEAERGRGYYTIKNGQLYLYGRDNLKAVAISGVFYDPVETARRPSCGEVFSDCEPFLDYNLYIDPAKYQKLLANTFQLIKGFQGGALLDTTPNSQPPTQHEPVRPY